MSSAGNAGSIGILHFRMGVITARESTSGQIILKILIIIINIFYSKAWCFCKEIRSHACIISSAKCSRLNLPTDTIHFPPFHIKLRNQSQIFFSNVPFAYRTNAFSKFLSPHHHSNIPLWNIWVVLEIQREKTAHGVSEDCTQCRIHTSYSTI